MIRFVTQRTLLLVPELLVISIGAFLIVHLAPGNPVLLLAGLHPTPAIIDALTKQWGLNLPLPDQYARFLLHALQGNLGMSMMEHRPVSELIAGAFPVTYAIGLGGTVVALGIGIPLGIVAAYRLGSTWDRLIVTGTSIGMSMPLFWLGLLLVIIFSSSWHLLPSAGWGSFSDLILPWLALGINGAALFARMTRTQLTETLGNDYVRTAQAKGLRLRRVVLKHAFRNALLPIVALLGLRLGYIVAGSVVLELVFLLPGMGQLMVSAILNSDYTLVQGCMLTLGASVLMANFLADLAYAFVNPVIRYN